MAHAYIVETARTAGGRRGGALRDWHPANLGAEVLNALVARSGIDGAQPRGGAENKSCRGGIFTAQVI